SVRSPGAIRAHAQRTLMQRFAQQFAQPLSWIPCACENNRRQAGYFRPQKAKPMPSMSHVLVSSMLSVYNGLGCALWQQSIYLGRELFHTATVCSWRTMDNALV